MYILYSYLDPLSASESPWCPQPCHFQAAHAEFVRTRQAEAAESLVSFGAQKTTETFGSHIAVLRPTISQHPQLPSKISQILSNRDYKAFNRATLQGLGRNHGFQDPPLVMPSARPKPKGPKYPNMGHIPVPPNYPLRYPKYHLIETHEALNGGTWGGLGMVYMVSTLGTIIVIWECTLYLGSWTL